MPKLPPVAWRDLIARLRDLGFRGPLSGGKYPYMVKGDWVVTVPNPHRGVIGPDLLSRILRQANISRDEWLGE